MTSRLFSRFFNLHEVYNIRLNYNHTGAIFTIFWHENSNICVPKKFQVIFWPLWSWMDVNFSIGIFKKRWQFPNDLNFVNQDLQSPHFSISFNLLPFWYKTKFFTKEFSSNFILFFPELNERVLKQVKVFTKYNFCEKKKYQK